MLRRNLIANYVGQGWTALMGLAFIPLYIQHLGIEAYGLIGFFAMLQAWLSLLDMGMTPTISREIACFTGGQRDAQSLHDLLRTIELITLGIALLIAGVIAAGSEWIATHWIKAASLQTATVAQAFTAMGFVSALRLAESIYRSCLIGLQRQVLFNVVNSIMATLRAVGAVTVLVWVSPTIEAFFLWQGAVSVLTLVSLSAATYKFFPRLQQRARFSVKALRSTWRFAGGVTLLTFIALLNTQIDKIAVSKFISLGEFGYYSLAIQLAALIFFFLIPITQAFYPRLSEVFSKQDPSMFLKLFHAGSQLATLVGGWISLALIFFYDVFLDVWLADSDTALQVGRLLVLAAIGNLLNSFLYLPMQAQLAHGLTRLPIITGAISSLLTLILVLIFVPDHGPVAALLIWILTRGCQFLVVPFFVFRRIMPGAIKDWYLSDIAYPLMTLFLAFSASEWLFAKLSSTGTIANLIMILLLSLICLLLGAFASTALRPVILRQLSRIDINLIG